MGEKNNFFSRVPRLPVKAAQPLFKEYRGLYSWKGGQLTDFPQSSTKDTRRWISTSSPGVSSHGLHIDTENSVFFFSQRLRVKVWIEIISFHILRISSFPSIFLFNAVNFL
jgi:hypothetical protein